MRLSRQLILLIVLLVLLLFGGTFSIVLHNARDYLSSQLASHAKDAATSLGLSVTSRLMEQDSAGIAALAGAMFDSGDYLQVRVENLEGEALVDLQAALRPGGVPQWFVDWVPLDTPLGRADLMQGWRQAGRVLVRSHPGHAYEQLWATTRESVLLHLLTGLLVLLVGSLALRVLLRPLAQVERQADAICRREFPVTTHVPATPELRRVVIAMNRLSGKVQGMLRDAERLAQRLQEQAHVDPVTGLANRRQFTDVLRHRTAAPEGMSGGLLLVGLRDFKEYNETYGYPAGDRLLAACGDMLSEIVAGRGRSLVAHLSGADFAVLLEDVDRADFERAAQRIADGLAGLFSRVELPSADVGHVGGSYIVDQKPEQLLSEADAALRQARRAGANRCVLHPDASVRAPERTAGEWRRLVTEALTADSLELVWQPVKACDGRLLQHEVFVRMRDPAAPGQLVAAGRFMPLVEGAGLAPRLDRLVLERVLDGLAARAAPPVAVNLSPASLEDNSLLDWLGERLEAGETFGRRLILEVPEYGATAHVEALSVWVEALAPFGVRFALDQFGRGFSSLGYLHGLKAHLLKIDGSFVRELDRNPDNQFLVQVLCDIAHGLDMRVIAEAVETEAVWRLLPGLGIDGGQGYWLGPPAAAAS